MTTFLQHNINKIENRLVKFFLQNLPFIEIKKRYGYFIAVLIAYLVGLCIVVEQPQLVFCKLGSCFK